MALDYYFGNLTPSPSPPPTPFLTWGCLNLLPSHSLCKPSPLWDHYSASFFWPCRQYTRPSLLWSYPPLSPQSWWLGRWCYQTLLWAWWRRRWLSGEGCRTPEQKAVWNCVVGDLITFSSWLTTDPGSVGGPILALPEIKQMSGLYRRIHHIVSHAPSSH